MWFGWPQLERGGTANHVNQLYNTDFTQGVETEGTDYRLPTGWSKDKDYAFDGKNHVVNAPEDMPEALEGNCMQITSTSKKSKRKIYQTLGITGGKNSVFTFGGWAKGSSLPGEEGKKPYFDLAISFRNRSNQYAKTYYLSFNKGQRGWQFGCRAVVAPYEFTAVRVSCVYSYNAEQALFSNVFLNREEFGRSYTYDDDKDVVAVSDRASQKSKMKYDSAKNVISYRKPGKSDDVVYTASYGSTEKQRKEHLVRWEKTPEGVVRQYSYDEYGNVVKTRVQKSGELGDGKLCLGSKTGYTEDGLFAVSSTDARGRQTVKEVDGKLGRVKSVTDARGSQAKYEYDESDRVTKVESEPESGKVYKNEYEYEEDRLKKVKHNTTGSGSDVEYRFEYDGLGRKQAVYVGEQKLSENVYGEDRSGLLKEVRYGNGGKVRYEYDEYDRTTGMGYDDELEARYGYEYDAEGRISKVKDRNLKREAWTEYDLAGRPIRVNQSGENEEGKQAVYYRSRLGYGKDGSLREFGESAGGKQYKTVYNYDKDDRIKKEGFKTGSGILGMAYSYDGIGRTESIERGTATVGSEQALTVSGKSELKSSYSYLGGDTGLYGSKAASGLIGKISYGDNGLRFEYSYDEVGNILTVKQYKGAAPEAPSVEYEYDKLGQLKRVNDTLDSRSGTNGTTWTYEYDYGGNLKSKKRYAYTRGDLSGAAVLENIPYTYSAEWKDRMDGYKGKPIEYDEIGNPLRHNGRAYEWRAGRQLSRMTMRTPKNAEGLDAKDGYDAESGTRLRIVFEDGNELNQEVQQVKAKARVYRNGRDITDEQPWTATFPGTRRRTTRSTPRRTKYMRKWTSSGTKTWRGCRRESSTRWRMGF